MLFWVVDYQNNFRGFTFNGYNIFNEITNNNLVLKVDGFCFVIFREKIGKMGKMVEIEMILKKNSISISKFYLNQDLNTNFIYFKVNR